MVSSTFPSREMSKAAQVVYTPGFNCNAYEDKRVDSRSDSVVTRGDAGKATKRRGL